MDALSEVKLTHPNDWALDAIDMKVVVYNAFLLLIKTIRHIPSPRDQPFPMWTSPPIVPSSQSKSLPEHSNIANAVKPGFQLPVHLSTFDSFPFHSIRFPSIPFDSIRFHSIPIPIPIRAAPFRHRYHVMFLMFAVIRHLRGVSVVDAEVQALTYPSRLLQRS